MSSRTLYQLTHDLQAVEALLENPDTPREAVIDTLEGISGAIAEKGKGIGALLLNWEANEKQVKEAANMMLARYTALKKRRESLRDYLLERMEDAGIEQISCPEFELTVVKNPPSVEIEDADELPTAFLEVKISKQPVKKAIKKAIQAGEEVPGAILTQKTRLRIR